MPMLFSCQNKSLHLIGRLKEFVERITILPCVILGGGMVAIVSIGVISRYVMQNPLPWSEEIARYLMNWMALLGVSIAFRRNFHLSLLFFISKAPILMQHSAKIFSNCLILVFLFILSFYGIKMVIAANAQIEPTIGIPMNYPLLCVPVCGIMSIIQVSLQIVNDLLIWKNHGRPFI
jgi:TRAP-type C4-dicarboxylate transport system permease small subunit